MWAERIEEDTERYKSEWVEESKVVRIREDKGAERIQKDVGRYKRETEGRMRA